MKVNTTRFGELDVDKKDIITFKEPKPLIPRELLTGMVKFLLDLLLLLG